MFLGLVLIYNFIYSQNGFTLPLTINNALGNIGAEVFGYMMSLNAFIVIFLTVFITEALKNYHRLVCVALSGITFAIGYGMLSFVDSIVGFVISTFIWTLGEIMNSISIGIFIADNTPINYRARISAIQNIIYWVGSSLSTVMSGVLVSSIGIKYIWIGIFIISLVASCLMYLLKIYCDRHMKA